MKSVSLGAIVLLAPVALAACSRTSAAPSSGEAANAPGLGEVMVVVARRFEVAGRAATAGRFELAEFEAGELSELFADDVPRASPPKEGPTVQIPAMAKSFLDTNLPALKKAAASKDAAAFRDAFRDAATACNACHLASQKAFIQIPTVPGQAVPDLEPLSAPGRDGG